MVSCNVGFIGAGRMAQALARGFLESGAVKNANQIVASCPKNDSHLLSSFKELGCNVTHCNDEVVENSDAIIFATKPQILPSALESVASKISEEKLLMSIAAGITIKQMENFISFGRRHLETSKIRLVRVMPNTACLVSEGASVYVKNEHVTQEDKNLIENMFGSVGSCAEIMSEDLIDAVTAVSGSGPAYMFLIIEAMADGGVKQGLPRDLAYKLAAQTMVGAGRMVLSTSQHPAVLKDQVCSPGGTTITALDTLEKNGLRGVVMQAVGKASERCKTLNHASQQRHDESVARRVTYDNNRA